MEVTAAGGEFPKGYEGAESHGLKNLTALSPLFRPSGGYGGGGYGGGGGGYGGGGGSGFGGSYGGGSNLGQGLHNIDFSKEELITFEKNFYIEHPDVSKRSDAEADAWRASHKIVVQGDDVPKPVMTFEGTYRGLAYAFCLLFFSSSQTLPAIFRGLDAAVCSY